MRQALLAIALLALVLGLNAQDIGTLPEFEVASIKPNKTGGSSGGLKATGRALQRDQHYAVSTDRVCLSGRGLPDGRRAGMDSLRPLRHHRQGRTRFSGRSYFRTSRSEDVDGAGTARRPKRHITPRNTPS